MKMLTTFSCKQIFFFTFENYFQTKKYLGLDKSWTFHAILSCLKLIEHSLYTIPIHIPYIQLLPFKNLINIWTTYINVKLNTSGHMNKNWGKNSYSKSVHKYFQLLTISNLHISKEYYYYSSKYKIFVNNIIPCFTF